jgi:hypothetical protein
MTTPRTIKGIIRATKEHYAKVDKARENYEQAEKMYKDINKVHWSELLIKPLSIQLTKHFPNRTVEILGPFGLSCEVSIWFKKKGLDEKKLFGTKDGVKSITFRPGDLDKGELRIVKTEEDDGTCHKGSIGELNGFNHPTITITSDMTINDLLKYVH